MDLRIVDLSESALEGVGRMVSPERWLLPGPGEDYSYVDTLGDLELEAPLCSGVLDCAPRPIELKKMERHLRTREMLVALEGEAIVCVAPPQEPAEGGLSGIAALRVVAGQGFIMERKAWHWIPFPVGKAHARFLVVFRSGTGKDDLYFCDLPAPIGPRG
jgi:ureidoglycolate hydrolase